MTLSMAAVLAGEYLNKQVVELLAIHKKALITVLGSAYLRIYWDAAGVY